MAGAEKQYTAYVSLIMAGGSGTRFWPLSRKSLPKQYLNLIGTRSLIQQTVDRLSAHSAEDSIFICSGASQSALLKKQLPEITDLILEPSGRNTAPCLMLSVATLLESGYAPSTVMGVFPADHYIGDEKAFLAVLDSAIETAASQKALVTLGITPTLPHTGYGYIEADNTNSATALKVKRFVEKPALEKAKEFLARKNFYWNSGMFLWRLDAITEAFESFLAAEWQTVKQAVATKTVTQVYPTLTKQPIDTAIMEKASNVQVIPATMEWSDIGSWNALLELVKSKTHSDNAILGAPTKDILLTESSNCLISRSSHKKIALIGVSDLIVVETEDALLISHRSQDQRVREIAETFDVG